MRQHRRVDCTAACADLREAVEPGGIAGVVDAQAGALECAAETARHCIYRTRSEALERGQVHVVAVIVRHQHQVDFRQRRPAEARRHVAANEAGDRRRHAGSIKALRYKQGWRRLISSRWPKPAELSMK